MQLRKICQHPFLFESVEDKVNPGGLVDDKLIRSSGKLELLSRILPKFFSTGHRVNSLSSLAPENHLMMYESTGTHLLPNDQGHGHYGRLLQDNGLEIPSARRWYEDRGACGTGGNVQREGLGVQGVHLVHACWWVGIELADCRYGHHVGSLFSFAIYHTDCTLLGVVASTLIGDSQQCVLTERCGLMNHLS